MNIFQKTQVRRLGSKAAIRWEPDFDGVAEVLVEENCGAKKYRIYEDGLVVRGWGKWEGEVVDLPGEVTSLLPEILITLEQARELKTFFRPYVAVQQGEEAEIYVYDDHGSDISLHRVRSNGSSDLVRKIYRKDF